ncbi:MAG: glycogen debranching protein GlgX [Rhodobacteraceae bacterium]|nr:glycogen debranching protein GlgX [Paracoccaceae bacterium]
MTEYPLAEGRPAPLGATVDAQGVNFAIFSEHAHKVELCLFSEDGQTELARISLPERRGPVWHGHVAGIGAGQLYGFRAHGPWAPLQGHRFNPTKLLVDPYARAFHGDWHHVPETLGNDPAQDDLMPSFADSAPFVPKCVVCATDTFDWQGDRHLFHRWSDTVIYEAHVKGLTQRLPGIPDALRGTYEALGHPVVIKHLKALGVTAIELLPVHEMLDEGFLADQDLKNYWGYNSIGFFAPAARYFGPNGRDGFKMMVRALHAAGIEVLLDVVYNHTAEGNHLGPTLSFRGLDNASYYVLNRGQQHRYANDTGTGNTVRAAHPMVLRLILDSLRFWVTEMHVDGFRFDLATTLAREEHGFAADGGLMDALRQDPVLSTVKLIAEPWDVGPGGYQRGAFPPEFSEWNDAYRDTVRQFWRGDAHTAQGLASALLGSADAFDHSGRRPRASVNLVTAHDGFTLADLTSYNHRHNHANGENNADGHHANFSENCGVEGDTDIPEVLEKRALRRRNILATLFFSQGVPMLLAGDELGHSQHGNNNAYNQDNETSWIDWSQADEGLLAFARRTIAFRKDHPSLRQEHFLHAQKRPSDGLPDVSWHGLDGGPVNWRDPLLDGFQVVLRSAAEAPAYYDSGDVVLLAINGHTDSQVAVLPLPEQGFCWIRALDTAAPQTKEHEAQAKEPMAPTSMVAFYRSAV